MTAKKLNGKLIKGIGGFYYAKPSDSSFSFDTVIECKALGKLRYSNITPAIGDEVELSLENNQWVISKIKERQNFLVRPSVSNVDIGLLCISAKSPKPDLLLLDKLIINCLAKDIIPIICITKSDLDLKLAKELKDVYSNIGFTVVLLSTEQQDELEKLEKLLKNKTVFLAGLSGVGKSTLSNRLCSYQMETGEISKKLKRGKHTTRHVELIEMVNGGFLVDTPGFSTLEILNEIDERDLKNFYPEFTNGECQFNNCNHINEPNCEIRNKVKNKELNMGRYLRYKQLFKDLSERKRY